MTRYMRVVSTRSTPTEVHVFGIKHTWCPVQKKKGITFLSYHFSNDSFVSYHVRIKLLLAFTLSLSLFLVTHS